MNNVSRRDFLILGTAVLALSACSTMEKLPVKYTVKDLLASTPFYIAHRGSGDNWPEHTSVAYNRSAEAGAKALEISVQATKDGVLVCHHDLTTLRMTGVDLEIAATNFAELSKLKVDARAWLGPNSVVAPIPMLKDVLDEHAANLVIFIEDKQGTNTDALLAMMQSYPDSTEHFVWKQPAQSRRFFAAKEAGFSTWGYFATEDFDKISQFAGNFDYVGIYHKAPDKVVKDLVAMGKPVICWEVHTRSLRDRMVALGVQGMMCSNYPYVTTAAPGSNHDQFSTGIRAAGDLPAALAWKNQPLILPGPATIRLEVPERSSYCMGSMCPIPADNYTIRFNMAWPDKVPADFKHAGIAFGQDNDAAYVVREESMTGGYHVVLRGSGSLELFSRPAGVVSGHLLKKVQTEPPEAGKWMRFQIQVSGSDLLVERSDGLGWRMKTSNDDFRGGYFSICRNFKTGPDIQFSAISVASAI